MPGLPDTIPEAPRLEYCPGLYLVGHKLRSSLANNRVSELWRGFMPVQAAISHRLDDRLLNVKVFDQERHADIFAPATEYEQWAGAVVSTVSEPPSGMDCLEISPGDYVVFIHAGPASASASTWHYIFAEWLPASEFELDVRPHFEVLPAGYRHDDPAAREEVWVPITHRGLH